MYRYLDVVMRDRPIGVWLLDESSGSRAKAYGYMPDGSYNGAAALGKSGPGPGLPRAVSLDGTAGCYVGLMTAAASGHLDNTTPQALEAWVYSSNPVDSSSAGIYVMGSTTGAVNPISLGSATGLLSGEVMSTANDQGNANARTGWSGVTLAAGWHHHVLTFSGVQGDWTWYCDGISIGSRFENQGGCKGFDGGLTYELGRLSGTSSQVVERVAGVGVFRGTLTQAQVQAHYNAVVFG